ncbi:MAG: hypothetical protein GF408_01480 [Candidatus Omnitrophica bacterium]|nr:hypothetical protein [Candidatus Omnitrophota bacterium]
MGIFQETPETMNTPPKIRVGIVGLGFGKAVHIPAFLAHSSFEITALSSDDLELSRSTARAFAVKKVFPSWREMLESPDLDAVSIATPPDIQADIATAALSSGKSVFCEKPLSVDPDSARKLVNAAEVSGKPNMIDFEFPEIQQWREAKRMLDEGVPGELREIEVSWKVQTYSNRNRLSSWKTMSSRGGGALNSFTSHVLYYLEWFAGPIRELSAEITRSPGDNRPGDTLNRLSALFCCGAKASVLVNTDDPSGEGHRLEFRGERGTILLENRTKDHVRGFNISVSGENMPVPETSGEDPGFREFSGDARVIPVSRITGRFLKWIRNSEPQKPDLRDGLRVQELLHAAGTSALSGGTPVNCAPKGVRK